MSELTAEAVRNCIASHPDPETGRPIGKTEQIVDVQVEQKVATIQLGLTSHSAAIADEVADAVQSKVVAAFPGTEVNVQLVPFKRMAARSGQTGLKVKSVIVVGSGKGGVGKSTVATSMR